MLQDNLAEAILDTLIIDGPKALDSPTNYDVRASLMWASTWALNGWLGCGITQDWATHRIGHEITAFFGLDHAQTLAIVLPGLLTGLKEQKAQRIQLLGKRVFGIETSSNATLVDMSIQATENFFLKMGIKTRLSDYNLGEEAIEKVCNRLKQRDWKLGECQDTDYQT